MLFKNSRCRNVFVAELTLISRWALHSPSLQRRWENKFSNFVLIKRNCSQFTFSGKGKGRVIFHWPFSPEQLLAGRLSLPGVEGDEEFQRWYFLSILTFLSILMSLSTHIFPLRLIFLSITIDSFINHWYSSQLLIFKSIYWFKYQLVVPLNCNFAVWSTRWALHLA